MELSLKQSSAWLALQDKIHSELLYGGGAGGGKTMLGCVWQVDRRIRYAGTRGFIARKTLKDIEESTLVTFFEVCKRMGYRAGEDFHYNSQKHIIRWRNGSVILLKELSNDPGDVDFQRLGSTEYTDGFIDEAGQVSRKAYEIMKSRIRYLHAKYDLTPKILITCNPGEGWIKDNFVIKDGMPVELKEYQLFIPALLTDNIDKEFVKGYQRQMETMTDEYDRRRLLYGDWEVQREVLNPFASHYKASKHESKEAIFRADKQLIISVDFNLNPFCVIFGHIWRDAIGWHCHIVDELSIENGSIPAMIDAIKRQYSPKTLMMCKLTGDAMGKNRDISQRDNSSYYDQLIKGLGLRDQQLHMPKSNPTHENSRADVNWVLEYFDDFKIHPENCRGTIRDFKNVQCDAFGSIIKRNRKDLNQLADFLDGARYLINSFLLDWVIRHRDRK